ncbi:MAG: molecular chaperone [Pirellulales bacterium]
MTTSNRESPAFDPALSAARQSLYRFAALSLLDPQAGAWEQLDALREDRALAAASAWIGALPEARPDVLGWGECSPSELDVARVLQRLPDSRQALNGQYEGTFGLLVANACPPYETEYIDGKLSFQRSNALADVSGFYRAFGLTTSSLHRERHDHVVLELEFMAFLLGLERQAACGDGELREERVAVCRDAQTRFFREHLAWWLPAFAKLLCREGRGRFYEGVGGLLAALVPAERAILGLPPVGRAVAPSALERPEACDGCELAGQA